ncbi:MULTISPECIES: NAD(P)-dependent oxidoreductase [unclassified Streptomyces]|uniref:NAD(P)-dependent oxidoreductase n=1 Tax=unclassified Streptomyces TaxID=2593676 RepID=UPI00224CB741|nr:MULTISPECIES: NAD(P)-dependent oxidoreductase [unclassified Streptomyces]WSP53456.1 NAD(P)-dependent oxidoreductase [Streptomyces sp. NBC_01241]MCX4784831.1 NAD(P)-dependent oxidoreductase [Streptomyces sp. NBC_01221]MCX4799216.1 NAD(P)-dependent oxidoreductase [Streptomyces sp. NBC_01242]WSJ40402.1 NAD(P)-dependent oxidoreductase [Streptomyces sp. NBC_01321]WSP66709.1 NAD(P)-dependent oxidoreductase [Streptomyces sp. NBC_01240]
MSSSAANATPQRPTVAVLGTGIMGSGMARSLLRAGLDVRAWNRTQAKAAPLAADGATVTKTADEAVRGADVILTMLNDGPAVAATLVAAAPGLHTDQVLLQSSTVGFEATADLARRAADLGLVYLDAPVSGTKQPAEQGALTVFVSGPSTVRATVDPVLEAIGQRTVWVAEVPGAASRLKLVVNTWVINLVNNIAECLNLAEGLEIDPQTFLDVMKGGPLDSPYLQGKSAAVLSGDLTPSFTLSTALKDTRLILDAAEKSGVRLDLVAASAGRFTRAEAAGHGGEDMIATYYAGRAPEKESH